MRNVLTFFFLSLYLCVLFPPQAWYVTSESRFRAEMSNKFDEVDVDGSGDIDHEELRALLKKLHHGQDPSPEDVDAAFKELDADNDGRIVREEFCKWYISGPILESRKKAAQDAQESDALEIEWPAEGNAAAKAMFVVTLPLVLLFSYTMPDVRRAGKFALGGLYADWYLFSFVVAIAWIGVLSYLMVWWATAIGRTLGIPDEPVPL